MSIRKELFGKTSKGEDVFIFTLENANGTIAKISTLGAVLVSLFTKDREGKFCDIVLGYDEVSNMKRINLDLGLRLEEMRIELEMLLFL